MFSACCVLCGMHLAHRLPPHTSECRWLAPRQTLPLSFMVFKKQFNLKPEIPGENRFSGERVLLKHWRVWQGGDTISCAINSLRCCADVPFWDIPLTFFVVSASLSCLLLAWWCSHLSLTPCTFSMSSWLYIMAVLNPILLIRLKPLTGRRKRTFPHLTQLGLWWGRSSGRGSLVLTASKGHLQAERTGVRGEGR